uniref:Uncharacterized protein n=1 Tax=Arundo donax TaxID=35708 RepID=A0A0A9G549_ARUDO
MWSSLPHRSLWKRPFHRSGCRPAAYTSLPWTPTLLPLALSLSLSLSLSVGSKLNAKAFVIVPCG